jgi:cystathionine gamma-lyase
MALDTLAIHAGQHPDPSSGAVMQPIVLSSTFAQNGPGEHMGFEYSRSGNPTRGALERCIAALEGAEFGLAFSSGCAATTALLHLLRPGDHVLSSDDVYGGTFRIFEKIMRPLGIESTFIDMSDLAAVAANLRPTTRMVWIESPSNPLLKIVDLSEVSRVVRPTGARVIVDNTFATPVLQRPLEFGATAVVHSTTKYLNGHSDVVGGAVVTSDAALESELRFLQNAMGGVPSPFDCYLVLRGLKTLPIRMRRHVESASAIADRLKQHPRVRRVLYPGLPEHPGYAVAKRQMAGPGGMISIEIDGGVNAARAFLRALGVFACAESLGGVESLAEAPALMTHASIPPAIRRSLGISDGLLRLSVGLEGEADLWADLERGLEASSKV